MSTNTFVRGEYLFVPYSNLMDENSPPLDPALHYDWTIMQRDTLHRVKTRFSSYETIEGEKWIAFKILDSSALPMGKPASPAPSQAPRTASPSTPQGKAPARGSSKRGSTRTR